MTVANLPLAFVLTRQRCMLSWLYLLYIATYHVVFPTLLISYNLMALMALLNIHNM